MNVYKQKLNIKDQVKYLEDKVNWFKSQGQISDSSC